VVADALSRKSYVNVTMVSQMTRELYKEFERLYHTQFSKGNQMHLICAPGSSSTHMIDITSVYPKQCNNEIEYNSTLLHD
jgi:hypothetical protein